MSAGHKRDEARKIEAEFEAKMERLKQDYGFDPRTTPFLAMQLANGKKQPFLPGSIFHWHRDPGQEGGIVVMVLKKVTRSGFDFESYSQDGKNKRTLRFTLKIHGQHFSALKEGAKNAQSEVDAYLEKVENEE